MRRPLRWTLRPRRVSTLQWQPPAGAGATFRWGTGQNWRNTILTSWRASEKGGGGSWGAESGARRGGAGRWLKRRRRWRGEGSRGREKGGGLRKRERKSKKERGARRRINFFSWKSHRNCRLRRSPSKKGKEEDQDQVLGSKLLGTRKNQERENQALSQTCLHFRSQKKLFFFQPLLLLPPRSQLPRQNGFRAQGSRHGRHEHAHAPLGKLIRFRGKGYEGESGEEIKKRTFAISLPLSPTT